MGLANPPLKLGHELYSRYVKLWVAHAPGMPGTFSPPPRVGNPHMHHGTCMTHVSWCMPESLTNGFLWNRCRGKRSRQSRRMRNPQFYVSGKRPMDDRLQPTKNKHVIAYPCQYPDDGLAYLWGINQRPNMFITCSYIYKDIFETVSTEESV